MIHSQLSFLDSGARRRIPLLVKLLYTAFVAVLVPFYWQSYGPTNFLYFCDVALLITVPALWLESPLLASAPLVGILLPQLLWMVDFLAEACGYTLTGTTAYMFNETIPRFTRGLSFFHFWLPIFLVWLVVRLGYDGRAFILWTVLAWIILAVCYFFLPGPDPARPKNLPVNINYVFGFSDDKPQDLMDSDLYFTLLMVFFPVGIFLPTHLLLGWLCPREKRP